MEEKVKEVIEDIDLKKESGDIEESLKKDVTINKEAVESALKKIKDKRKETIEAEATEAIYLSLYLQEMQKLYLQKKRRELSGDKTYLKTIGENGLYKQLLEGTLTPSEFRDKVNKAKEEKAKAYRESARIFNEYHETLKLKYQGFWNYGWDDPIWEARTSRY